MCAEFIHPPTCNRVENFPHLHYLLCTLCADIWRRIDVPLQFPLSSFVVSPCRKSDNVQIVTQVNAFDTHQHEDELEMGICGSDGDEPVNPQHLFRCILRKVRGTLLIVFSPVI